MESVEQRLIDAGFKEELIVTIKARATALGFPNLDDRGSITIPSEQTLLQNLADLGINLEDFQVKLKQFKTTVKVLCEAEPRKLELMLKKIFPAFEQKREDILRAFGRGAAVLPEKLHRWTLKEALLWLEEIQVQDFDLAVARAYFIKHQLDGYGLFYDLIEGTDIYQEIYQDDSFCFNFLEILQRRNALILKLPFKPEDIEPTPQQISWLQAKRLIDIPVFPQKNSNTSGLCLEPLLDRENYEFFLNHSQDHNIPRLSFVGNTGCGKTYLLSEFLPRHVRKKSCPTVAKEGQLASQTSDMCEFPGELDPTHPIKLCDVEGNDGGFPEAKKYNGFSLKEWVKSILAFSNEKDIDEFTLKRKETVTTFLPAFSYCVSDAIFYVGTFGGGNVNWLQEVSDFTQAAADHNLSVQKPNLYLVKNLAPDFGGTSEYVENHLLNIRASTEEFLKTKQDDMNTKELLRKVKMCFSQIFFVYIPDRNSYPNYFVRQISQIKKLLKQQFQENVRPFSDRAIYTIMPFLLQQWEKDKMLSFSEAMIKAIGVRTNLFWIFSQLYEMFKNYDTKLFKEDPVEWCRKKVACFGLSLNFWLQIVALNYSNELENVISKKYNVSPSPNAKADKKKHFESIVNKKLAEILPEVFGFQPCTKWKECTNFYSSYQVVCSQTRNTHNKAGHSMDPSDPSSFTFTPEVLPKKIQQEPSFQLFFQEKECQEFVLERVMELIDLPRKGRVENVLSKVEGMRPYLNEKTCKLGPILIDSKEKVCFLCGAPATAFMYCGHWFCKDCSSCLLALKKETSSCPFHKECKTRLSQVERNHFPSKNCGIRVLAIDGGGARGLVSNCILRCLQQKLGKWNLCLDQVFDLVAGTSAGSINAALVTNSSFFKKEDSPKEIRTLLEKMFNPGLMNLVLGKNLTRVAYCYIFGALYSLSSVWGDLQKKFDAGLRISMAKTNLMLVSTCAQQGQVNPVLFVNFPPLKMEDDDKHHINYVLNSTLEQAISSSCAAPSYFPPVLFQQYEFWDGGILHNNPSRIATQTAKQLWPDNSFSIIVNLGNGTNKNRGDLDQNTLGLQNFFSSVLGTITNTSRDLQYLKTSFHDRFFRLSPTSEIFRDVSLDCGDPKILQAIEEETNKYLDTESALINEVVGRLITSNICVLQIESYFVAEEGKLVAKIYLFDRLKREIPTNLIVSRVQIDAEDMSAILKPSHLPVTDEKAPEQCIKYELKISPKGIRNFIWSLSLKVDNTLYPIDNAKLRIEPASLCESIESPKIRSALHIRRAEDNCFLDRIFTVCQINQFLQSFENASEGEKTLIKIIKNCLDEMNAGSMRGPDREDSPGETTSVTLETTGSTDENDDENDDFGRRKRLFRDIVCNNFDLNTLKTRAGECSEFAEYLYCLIKSKTDERRALLLQHGFTLMPNGPEQPKQND